VLIGRGAAQEIAASGRWRMRFIAVVNGLILVLSRFTGESAERWTSGHIAAVVVGGALLLYAAWDVAARGRREAQRPT